MNARVIELIAGSQSRWPLAGDQFFVDLDLGARNVPPGTRLGLGTAVLEVTNQPHTGCAKFIERFGLDAMKFVNSADGRALQLRGINARVITSGRVRTGDSIRKLPPS
jgi:MOSC domain-containing protein YiiM